MEKFYIPQRQEGYVSVRLKTVAGNITAEQISTIKEIAETFGNGNIHVTSRQEFSIPFIKPEDIPKIEEVIANSDIKPAFVGSRFKTVMSCKGISTCRSGFIDTMKIARELDARHVGRALPRKLTVAVTGCPHDCMRVTANDIGVKGCKAGYIVYFGGKNILPVIKDEEKLYKIIDATVNYFIENAKTGERFSRMLNRLGTDGLKEALTIL